MSAPRFSVSGVTTLHCSFQEDLEICRKVGAEGLAFHEDKLRDDRQDLELFRATGLEATSCAPEIFSILPVPYWPGPEEPATRVERICAGIRRLAPFEPNSCTVVTGPQGRYAPEEARELIVEAYRRIAPAAADVGVTVALEPFHRNWKHLYTIVGTLPEMLELLDDIDTPNIELLFDVWHLWDTPDLLAQIREHAHRFVGCHVNDWRDPTRGWCDRVLPGDGIADLPGIFGALDEGGFEGWLDLEIISDDGTFGEDYPDSLWKEDPVELVRRGLEQTRQVWAQRRSSRTPT
jgi:sugar phosphate isomerase/epimerase